MLNGLYRFVICPKDSCNPREIVAKTATSAWRKFCTQYFAELKPNRQDYTVRKVKQ